MKFERGLDPKISMEIGGIDLQKKYDETVGEWKKFYSQFIGKTIRFTIDKSAYSNWDFRLERGELTEIKTMLVKRVNGGYNNQSGPLYFLEKESGQMWFVDMSKRIYIINDSKIY
jgi:hypothetical protein